MDIYKDDRYIGFPHLRCDFVLDDNIKDYVIIYYDYYYGAGTRRNAVVVNPDTGRVVVFNGAST